MSQRSITNDALLQLMGQHGLTQVDVGRLLGVALVKDKRRKTTYQCPTVASYCADPDSKSYRDMPKDRLELLQLKLSAVK